MIEHVVYDEIWTDLTASGCVLRVSINSMNIGVSSLIEQRKTFAVQFGNDGFIRDDAGYVVFDYLATMKGKVIYQGTQLFHAAVRDQIPVLLATLVKSSSR